jgi:nucleosome binding factor SPN SPT16 subunit
MNDDLMGDENYEDVGDGEDGEEFDQFNKEISTHHRSLLYY